MTNVVYAADDREEIDEIINQEYKNELRELRANYKDKYRDNKQLQKFAGSTEGTELEQMYHQYQVEQTQKDIKKLDVQMKLRIKAAVELLPDGDIKPIQGYRNLYRLRVGEYRVIFSYESTDEIMIKTIAPRGQVYKHL